MSENKPCQGRADGFENKSPLTCPKDGSLMEIVAVEQVELDRCPDCGGMWFDLGELRGLLETDGLDKGDLLRKDQEKEHADVRRRTVVCCPRDGFAMMEIKDSRQQHVAYELCMMCGGVFLDGGEFKDLSRFTLVERVRAALGR